MSALTDVVVAHGRGKRPTLTLHSVPGSLIKAMCRAQQDARRELRTDKPRVVCIKSVLIDEADRGLCRDICGFRMEGVCPPVADLFTYVGEPEKAGPIGYTVIVERSAAKVWPDNRRTVCVYSNSVAVEVADEAYARRHALESVRASDRRNHLAAVRYRVAYLHKVFAVGKDGRS